MTQRGKWWKMLLAKAMICDPSHAPKNISVRVTAASFTVNDNVCSCICVAAWKIATISPKNILISTGGADRMRISIRP